MLILRVGRDILLTADTENAAAESDADLVLGHARQFYNDCYRIIVFGDIDLQGHRDWVESVCRQVNMSCHLPLWNSSRETLARELIEGIVTKPEFTEFLTLVGYEHLS